MSLACPVSSGGGEVAERIDLMLAELRALLGRIDEHRLEADDWAVVDALVAELIEQAEPGKEWVVVELSEEEKDSGGKTCGAVGAEDSTSESIRNVASTPLSPPAEEPTW
jgi:hypothetical protein